MKRREQPYKCPCTGRMTYGCDCMHAPVVKGKTAQEYIQERENLKYLVSMCHKALIVLGVLLVGVAIGALSGCATTPGNTVTPPSGPVSIYNDQSRYDESIIAMCEAQSLTVAYELVSQSPEAFTVEAVTDIVGYLYGNCLRDNGRGA